MAEISRFFDIQDGGRRHLGFSKFKFLEGQAASLYQISLKSLQPLPRYGDFSIFQDGPAAILDFKNFILLTVGTVKRVKQHHCAKCHKNLTDAALLSEPRPRYVEFQYYASLASKCLFTPLFGFFWHIPPNNVTHRPDPKNDQNWAESAWSTFD